MRTPSEWALVKASIEERYEAEIAAFKARESPPPVPKKRRRRPRPKFPSWRPRR